MLFLGWTHSWIQRSQPRPECDVDNNSQSAPCRVLSFHFVVDMCKETVRKMGCVNSLARMSRRGQPRRHATAAKIQYLLQVRQSTPITFWCWPRPWTVAILGQPRLWLIALTTIWHSRHPCNHLSTSRPMSRPAADHRSHSRPRSAELDGYRLLVSRS